MSDRIEKTVELKAPVSRVWRALTDHREFGEWFRVRLEGPFVPSQVARGNITHPGPTSPLAIVRAARGLSPRTSQRMRSENAELIGASSAQCYCLHLKKNSRAG